MLFVGGIHGVGKTFLGKKIANKINVPHFSSSNLIALQKQQAFETDKRIQKVEENQDFLIEAIRSLNIPTKNFILDGHFCLLNKEEKIMRIPQDTFVNLNPNAILIIKDSIEMIFQRLKKRDNQIYSLALLELFQQEEIQYAKEIANLIDVPLFIHDNTESLNNLFIFIKDFMGDYQNT